MGEFIILIYVVIAILGAILFFKVWGMCNDIRVIREHLIREETNTTADTHKDEGFSTSSIVTTIIVVMTLLIIIGSLI